MNFEYVISRGTILLGVFTFGVAVAQSVDFLFDYWNFLTGISTAGLLTVAFWARKDYKSVKSHEFQVDLLRSLAMNDSKRICFQLTNNINKLTTCLTNIRDVNLPSLCRDQIDSLLENYTTEAQDFYTNHHKFREIKIKIELLDKKGELEKIHNDGQKVISSFLSGFSLIQNENIYHTDPAIKIASIKEKISRYSDVETQKELNLSDLLENNFRTIEITTTLALTGIDLENEGLRLLKEKIKSNN